MRKALWHQWRLDERMISDEWLASEWKVQNDDEWLKCH